MAKNKSKERIGETRKANNGMLMTIIAYKTCRDIDIQFEDGIIVCHKNYDSFLRGEIRHPNNYTTNKKERIGEEHMSNCGLNMKIIGYRNMDDLDVQFEDGTIMKNQKYKNFQIGQITPPHMSYDKRHIGEQVKSKQGIITLIKYRKYKDIDVQFEDGTTIKNVSYSNFKRGQISKIPRKKIQRLSKKERENETVRASNGLMMKIKEYRTANDIDVEFEDGIVVYNKTYAGFKKGCVPHPNNKPCTHIGEEKYAYNGLLMKIVGYRNREDLDIEFEDGIVVKNKTYKIFQSGYVKHPYISSQKAKINRTGEINFARNGMRMKILKYRTNNDIDVEFEDGTIIEHKTYQNFRIGNISHPNISLTYISIPEAIILFYLSQIGFEKKNQGYFSKFHPSFGRTEIDIFNENLMIGIEYDGFYFHKEADVKYRDDEKDKSCEKAGILLIRIRENGLLETNCKNTINIFREKNHDIKELENIIHQILDIVSEKSKQKYQIDINIFRDYNKIIKLASDISIRSKATHIPPIKDRTGETRIHKNGLLMTIISYRNRSDIDIQFEDGVIVCNKTYPNFNKGYIRYPYSRIGETKTAKNGMRMTIIDYRNYNDIDIQFKDGSIAKNKSYQAFKTGHIAHPTIKLKDCVNFKK